jgi:hypothetical protein
MNTTKSARRNPFANSLKEISKYLQFNLGEINLHKKLNGKENANVLNQCHIVWLCVCPVFINIVSESFFLNES